MAKTKIMSPFPSLLCSLHQYSNIANLTLVVGLSDGLSVGLSVGKSVGFSVGSLYMHVNYDETKISSLET